MLKHATPAFDSILVHIFPGIHICSPAFWADNLVLFKDKHFDLVIRHIGGHNTALTAFAQKQDFAVKAHRQAFSPQAERLFDVLDLFFIMYAAFLKCPFIFVTNDVKCVGWYGCIVLF